MVGKPLSGYDCLFVCLLSGGGSSSNKQTTQQQQHGQSDADIQRLVSQGFNRQQVIEELQRCGGNVEQALAALIAKSLQIP